MNLLLELRGGTNVYLDIIDHPETVSDFILFARKFNIMIQEIFFREIENSNGGTFSNLGQWIPCRIVTESLDPLYVASVEFFEQWVKKIQKRYLNILTEVVSIFIRETADIF